MCVNIYMYKCVCVCVKKTVCCPQKKTPRHPNVINFVATHRLSTADKAIVTNRHALFLTGC